MLFSDKLYELQDFLDFPPWNAYILYYPEAERVSKRGLFGPSRIPDLSVSLSFRAAHKASPPLFFANAPDHRFFDFAD